MARRGAGEGTVVKRKKCEACGKIISAAREADLKECKHCKAVLPKEGTWMGAATIGFDVEKNKPARKFYYGKTRSKVVEKMGEAQTRAKNGQITEPSKVLLAEWLDTWLNNYMRPSLRPTTWQSYETQVRKHIKPAIGHVRLNQLQTSHLQKLYNDKLQGGRGDGKEGGLSPRSVRYIHVTLHGALEQAKKEGMIIVNPADNVKLPKQDKKEIEYFDSEAVGKFLNAAKETRYFAAYYLELATGLRRGELLALRWKDVDLQENSVTVNQGLVRVTYKDGKTKTKLIFQKPKTALANRTISIPPEVAGVLEFYKRRQNNEREKAGEAWQKEIIFLNGKPEDNDLVFTNEIGGPLDPRSFTHNFERLIERCNREMIAEAIKAAIERGLTEEEAEKEAEKVVKKIPRISFHGMRHTFATMSLQEGVDIRTTQENLGHHAAAFTLDVYSSVTKRMKKEATDKIGNLLNNAMENK